MVANKTKCNFLSMMVTEIINMKHMNKYVKKKKKKKIRKKEILKKKKVKKKKYKHFL